FEHHVQAQLHLRPHVAYHIVCTEDVTEIEDRFAWSGDMVEGNIILLSQEDLLQQMRFLRDGSESREADDAASTGLSQVFKEARERGLLVYLSSLGADEIISDLVRGEQKRTVRSFSAFPEDLNRIFPWTSFFLGTQRKHLMWEELIAGAHGIEGRYPFLDKRVVQEYLWLTASAKNAQYKAPLHQLFKAVGYPFQVHRKIGFNGVFKMKFGSESLKFRQGNLELLEAKSSRLQAELAQLERREAEVAAANLEVERLQNYLAEQDDELEAEAARSDVEQMQRIQMTLFTMVPR
ncbi:unnamed protein product, partial [Durusdinium trenchii]